MSFPKHHLRHRSESCFRQINLLYFQATSYHPHFNFISLTWGPCSVLVLCNLFNLSTIYWCFITTISLGLWWVLYQQLKLASGESKLCFSIYVSILLEHFELLYTHSHLQNVSIHSSPFHTQTLLPQNNINNIHLNQSQLSTTTVLKSLINGKRYLSQSSKVPEKLSHFFFLSLCSIKIKPAQGLNRTMHQ